MLLVQLRGRGEARQPEELKALLVRLWGSLGRGEARQLEELKALLV